MHCHFTFGWLLVKINATNEVECKLTVDFCSRLKSLRIISRTCLFRAESYQVSRERVHGSRSALGILFPSDAAVGEEEIAQLSIIFKNI